MALAATPPGRPVSRRHCRPQAPGPGGPQVPEVRSAPAAPLGLVARAFVPRHWQLARGVTASAFYAARSFGHAAASASAMQHRLLKPTALATVSPWDEAQSLDGALVRCIAHVHGITAATVAAGERSDPRLLLVGSERDTGKGGQLAGHVGWRIRGDEIARTKARTCRRCRPAGGADDAAREPRSIAMCPPHAARR